MRFLAHIKIVFGFPLALPKDTLEGKVKPKETNP